MDIVKRFKRDLSKFKAKSKKAKIKQVIGIIVFIVIVVICLTNDRAHSILVQVGDMARAVSGTESRPATTTTTTMTTTTDNQGQDNLRTLFPSTAPPQYSTTNREGRAAEIREAEMQELRDAIKK